MYINKHIYIYIYKSSILSVIKGQHFLVWSEALLYTLKTMQIIADL